MRRSAMLILLIGTISLLLSACRFRVSQSSEGSAFRVVVGVTVTYENGPIQAQRVYTSAEKMQRVLNYLRLIDPYGTPQEDPEASGGSDYRIALHYSDGTEKIYRQKNDRYMQEGSGGWKKIDPARAEELGKIMGQLESDDWA